MLDWNTSKVAQQLRYGSYLNARQLYELGAMMLTEGEPQVKVPRYHTSSTPNFNIQSLNRMNDQSVQQYLSMQLAEARAKESQEAAVSNTSLHQGIDGRPQIPSRKQREFINDTYKDDHYWEKRRKNNDAARRSREKRRYHDMVLEGRICDISKENDELRNELSAIKRKFNLPLDQPFTDMSDANLSVSHQVPSSPPSLKYNQATMAPSKPHIPSTTISKGMAYSSPPPLLAVTGPMAVPSQSVYPSNGAQYPYYLNMPSSESSSRVPHYESNGSNSSNHSSGRTSYQPEQKDIQIKEEQDDSKSPPPLSIALDTDPRPPESNQSYDYYHQHHSNLGYSSDSWQGSPSNSNSYGSDEMLEQPLQLTVRKDADGGEKKDSKSQQASSFPLKLRHKLPSQDYYTPTESSFSSSRPYVNGLAQLSEIALAQANPLTMMKTGSQVPPQSMLGFSSSAARKHKPGNPKYIDPKYIERRRRNNEAARKCRENRKYVTNMREAKSDYLQEENGKLRDELGGLQEEMKQLRDLMEKKRLEQGLTEDEMNEKMNESMPPMCKSDPIVPEIQYPQEFNDPPEVKLYPDDNVDAVDHHRAESDYDKEVHSVEADDETSSNS